AKVCFKDKFWIIMIVFFFLYQLGGMLKNVSQIYFCQAMFNDGGAYSIEIGGRFSGLISIIGAVPTALGMVIAWPLSNKIGKGKAILFGAVISAIGGAIGFIAPDNFVVVVIAFVVKALGSTPAMYLSLALLADITDHQEAMHGFRTDGLTMTIYGAIMAGMTGLATGILNGILGGVGYTDTNVSSELIRKVMPWIFLGGEAICYGVIAIIFVFMGVEKFQKFDHKAIVLDQKAKADAEGVEYVNPQLKMMLEEAESVVRTRCKSEGLDFDSEFAKEKAEVYAKYEKETAEKEAKEAAKANPEKEAEILKEFNDLRVKNGREPLAAE
ncbi:MAG: MFS transporter, partial [Clostridia bacterium]|nr:MFS transporter [Clostridia bacterium]